MDTKWVPFYTPERIDYLLRNWPMIWALSQTPQSARGLLQPGETREAPRLKRPKGYHGDQLGWAVVVADVEKAWMQLLGEGRSVDERVRWLIICYRLSGYKLGQIGSLRGLHIRTETVVAEYKVACELMSRTLGGAVEEGGWNARGDDSNAANRAE